MRVTSSCLGTYAPIFTLFMLYNVVVYLLDLHLLLSLRFGHFLNTENETPSKKPMVVDVTSHFITRVEVKYNFITDVCASIAALAACAVTKRLARPRRL